MRALTSDEYKKLFDKLAQYIGQNTTHLLEQKGENECVFRLHKSRIWYIPKELAKLSSCVAKSNLMGIGFFAKVTHNGHIRIQITALEYIAQYAVFKIWVKPNQEQKFLYGGNVTRAGLGRITESTPKYQKVAVFSMGDSTLDCRKCEMNSQVLFHEADVGEYLRDEERHAIALVFPVRYVLCIHCFEALARYESFCFSTNSTATKALTKWCSKMTRTAKVFPDYNFRSYFVNHVKEDFSNLQKMTPDQQDLFVKGEGQRKLGQMQRMVIMSKMYSTQSNFLDCNNTSKKHVAVTIERGLSSCCAARVLYSFVSCLFLPNSELISLEQIILETFSPHIGPKNHLWGSVLQIYGPPMVGKTEILQRIVKCIIEKCNQSNNLWKGIHLYLCTTPGELLIPNEYWNESHHKDSFIDFFEVCSSNDLLEVLNCIRCNISTSSTQNVIIIDSFSFIWQDLMLTKVSQNEIHWYYLNLLQQLRMMLNDDDTSGLQKTTAIVCNGCQLWTKPHTSEQNKRSIWAPLPLGSDTWNNGVDISLYMEPYYYVKRSDKDPIHCERRGILVAGEQVVSVISIARCVEWEQCWAYTIVIIHSIQLVNSFCCFSFLIILLSSSAFCSSKLFLPMFIIYVDNLSIRLPDGQTTFNPRYAFSFRTNAVLGLKIRSSGHLLLPNDAEGSIPVSPGERYTLVHLAEKEEKDSCVPTQTSSPPKRTTDSIVQHSKKQNDCQRNCERQSGITDSRTTSLSTSNVDRAMPTDQHSVDAQADNGGRKKDANAGSTEIHNNALSEDTSLVDLCENRGETKKGKKRLRASSEPQEPRVSAPNPAPLRKHPLDNSSSDSD
eukprot:gene6217-4475_t